METRRVRLPPQEIDRLADEIAELSAHIDAAAHRLLTLIRRFDESSGWAEQGALTCAHWLSWRIGLDLGAAREHVRVARALAVLPAVDDALRHGRVSYSKVRALTRVATPETEATLLEWARSSTALQLERICRKYRFARSRAGLSPGHEGEIRYVRVRERDSGMIRIEVQLPPEEAAVILKALDAVSRRSGVSAETSDLPVPTDDVSAETFERSRLLMEPMRLPDRLERRLRRADALVAMAEGCLADWSNETPRTPPVEIVVHVERELRGATLDDGTPLPENTAAKLACDASVLRVVEDERGTPLDIGRRTRTIPAALKRALRLRDRGCRFPGCTNRLVDGHHIVPWSKGGSTKLANLCSLCRRHYGFVHERGYRIELRDGNELVFFTAGGVPILATGIPPEIVEDRTTLLRRAHAEAGIEVDAMTSYPKWDGKPVDYGLAVQVLWERTAAPSGS